MAAATAAAVTGKAAEAPAVAKIAAQQRQGSDPDRRTGSKAEEPGPRAEEPGPRAEESGREAEESGREAEEPGQKAERSE